MVWNEPLFWIIHIILFIRNENQFFIICFFSSYGWSNLKLNSYFTCLFHSSPLLAFFHFPSHFFHFFLKFILCLSFSFSGTSPAPFLPPDHGIPSSLYLSLLCHSLPSMFHRSHSYRLIPWNRISQLILPLPSTPLLFLDLLLTSTIFS